MVGRVAADADVAVHPEPLVVCVSTAPLQVLASSKHRV